MVKNDIGNVEYWIRTPAEAPIYMSYNRKEYQKNWRVNNRKWLENYRLENEEKIKKQSRERYFKNKKRYNETSNAWYQMHGIKKISNE